MLYSYKVAKNSFSDLTPPPARPLRLGEGFVKRISPPLFEERRPGGEVLSARVSFQIALE